jgi:hypothetical protein
MDYIEVYPNTVHGIIKQDYPTPESLIITQNNHYQSKKLIIVYVNPGSDHHRKPVAFMFSLNLARMFCE